MEREDLAELLGALPAMEHALDVMVSGRDQEAFKVAFTDAVASGGRVFLADETWGDRERETLMALREECRRRGPDADGRGWLCIPTGGSSGRLKFARHDEKTIGAAVSGFCEYFGVHRVNAFGMLPLHHVSGFMAWMRCLLTGGKYRPVDWDDIASGYLPHIRGGDWFISLVPTQLARLLKNPEAVAWMRDFRGIFIGGGPSWPELVEAGATAGLPLVFSYGMTETAAMVTALKPEAFLAGQRGVGQALSHAGISINSHGRIVVRSPSLFLGYAPQRMDHEEWTTDDLGELDRHGSLTIMGRHDALIITGGEKVDPAEIEAVLRMSGEFHDVAVIGVPDPDWGQMVVACYPESQPCPRPAKYTRVLSEKLAAWKHPKRYEPIGEWPRSKSGKINRMALAEALAARSIGR